MVKLVFISLILLTSFIFPYTTFAQEPNSDILNFTNSTLQILTLIAAAGAAFFLIKSGYTYMTSTGKPEALQSAKKTFKNALIGLVLVLSASVIASVFQNALEPSDNTQKSIL